MSHEEQEVYHEKEVEDLARYERELQKFLKAGGVLQKKAVDGQEDAHKAT